MPRIFRYHHPMFDIQLQLDDALRQVSGPKVLLTVEHVDNDFSEFHVTNVIDLHNGTFPEQVEKQTCAVCFVPRNDAVAMSKMEEELQNPHFGVYHVHYYDVDSSHIANLNAEPSLPVPIAELDNLAPQ